MSIVSLRRVTLVGSHGDKPATLRELQRLGVIDVRNWAVYKHAMIYYDIVVEGERNEDAAWYYPEPKEKAAKIKDHIAFWKGVEIVS